MISFKQSTIPWLPFAVDMFLLTYLFMHFKNPAGGGGGTATYGLYRYVPLWRVWFSSSLLKDRVYKSEHLGLE